jgi:hypothetical protein
VTKAAQLVIYGRAIAARIPALALRRIEPVEILVKLVFHLLNTVKFDLSFRDFGIALVLFQH